MDSGSADPEDGEPRSARDRLEQTLCSWGELLTKHDYVVPHLVFEPPAAPGEVAEMEADLGVAIPAAFRSALLTISRRVEFSWFAPLDHRFPEPFDDIFRGDLHWSIDALPQCEDGRTGWIDAAFTNPTDEYDAVWRDKLAFYDVGNGDYMAFDLAPDAEGAVVYLSHEHGEGHGYLLGHDFADLLARWVPIGCPGGEDWQWLPFVDGPHSGIEPAGEHGLAWRELLNAP